MRPALCPAMWPRDNGSWVPPLLLAISPRLASGWEGSPTAKGIAQASAGMVSAVLCNRAPCVHPGLHSYGRAFGGSVSRNYRALKRLSLRMGGGYHFKHNSLEAPALCWTGTSVHGKCANAASVAARDAATCVCIDAFTALLLLSR